MIRFTKMHGLGNDFVVIDAINQALSLTTKQIKLIADRRYGVGCDQLLLVEKSTTDADFKYRIFNADGSEVAQCGNGARCLARFLRKHKLTDKNEIKVATSSGQLTLRFDADDLITINMGIPHHHPAKIPLNMEAEARTYQARIGDHELRFAAVSVGNPHAVITVDAIQSAPVAEWGKHLAQHPIFPQQANIGFMQIINRQRIKLRVYERGAAETLACGSGACAAVIVGIEQQLLDKRPVQVELTGGELTINWSGRNQPVFMSGSATTVFEGRIEL